MPHQEEINKLIDLCENNIKLWVDWEHADMVTVNNASIQKTLKESLECLETLRVLVRASCPK